MIASGARENPKAADGPRRKRSSAPGGMRSSATAAASDSDSSAIAADAPALTSTTSSKPASHLAGSDEPPKRIEVDADAREDPERRRAEGEPRQRAHHRAASRLPAAPPANADRPVGRLDLDALLISNGSRSRSNLTAAGHGTQIRNISGVRRSTPQSRRQPLTLAELRAGGVDFPAVVIGELELGGYVIERVIEHDRQIGVRLLEPDAPDPPAAHRRRRRLRGSR